MEVEETEEETNMEDNRVPPVRAGDVLEDIIPNGRAKEDLFVNHHGLIIFIKRVPKGMEEERMTIKVTAVKNSFAFAEYRGERS